MARSITTRSTNPKIMDDNIKILDDALASASTPPAEDVSYDNTDSGLTADDVQAAIDELKTGLDNITGLKYFNYDLESAEYTAGTWYRKLIDIQPGETSGANRVAAIVTNDVDTIVCLTSSARLYVMSNLTKTVALTLRIYYI